MAVRGFSPGKQIVSPRGAWTSTDQRRMGSPSRASIMWNQRVAPGITRSRDGTSIVAPASGFVTGIFNWIDPFGVNHVIYRDGSVIRNYVQGGVVSSILSNIGNTYRPSQADLDVWDYICGYDTAGAGTFQCRIFDGANSDKAFAPPMTISASAVDGGTGQCTMGTHYIGVVYQNRSGYSGIPTTSDSSGNPISVTLNAGLRKVNVTISIPARTDGGTNPTGAQATLFLIVTPANNPTNWFFLPGPVGASASVEQQPVPFNEAVNLNFVFDLSDFDLEASADPLITATFSQFSLLWQAADGSGPFNPNVVVAYGQRMVYGAGTACYVSDINNPQQISIANNQVVMPNKRYIAAAFPLPNGTDLFLTGDRWTARVTDNSDSPSTWAEPVKISDALGAAFANLVCFKTGGGYAWVVTEGGPYMMNGTYLAKPLTYLSQDQWNRVNWQAAYAIEIADDVAKLKLYIAVPLDGATMNTHVFVFDYQNGTNFDEVDFSIDQYNQQYFQSIGSIGVVKEIGTNQTNLWIGPVGGNQPNYPITLQVTDSLGNTSSVNCYIDVACAPTT